MSDFYAPELEDPGEGDMLGAMVRALVCDHAGHEWADAGGGIDICVVCEGARERPAGVEP